jgi:membrane protein DedA with SNARE-associated domain
MRPSESEEKQPTENHDRRKQRMRPPAEAWNRHLLLPWPSTIQVGRAKSPASRTSVEALADWVLRFLDEHTLTALFLFLLLEESGIPMPVPGDLVVLLAGVRVGQGQTHLLVALLVMQLGSLLGTSILYWVARRGGRPMLYRYGKFLRLQPDQLVKAEDFLHRRGALAVVAGRLIPGLRIPTSLAAGAFRVPYLVFVVAATIGSDIYNIFFFMLGYLFGPQILDAIGTPRLSVRFVVMAVSVALVIATYIVIRRRSHLTSAAPVLSERVRLETALMAGLLATIATAVALNLLLYGLAALDQPGPEAALVALAEAVRQRFGTHAAGEVLLGTIAVHVGLQLLWAVAYAHFVRWLPRPDWLGGLLFALLPLGFSLGIVLPMLGAGLTGLSLGMGLVPLAGELVRNTIYAWSLSTSYTLLSRARARG